MRAMRAARARSGPLSFSLALTRSRASEWRVHGQADLGAQLSSRGVSAHVAHGEVVLHPGSTEAADTYFSLRPIAKRENNSE